MTTVRLACVAFSTFSFLGFAACGKDDAAQRGDGGPGAAASDAAIVGQDAAADGGEALDAASLDAGADANPLAPRAGRRLRAIGYAVGEFQVRTGIYDDERKGVCDFMATGDEAAPTLHCVPTAFAELGYADAKCTEERVKLGSSASSCATLPEAGAIVRVAGASACGSLRLLVRRLGAKAKDAATYRRDYASGDCVKDDVTGSTLRLAEPADLDQLVSAEVELVATGEPGLQLEMLVGSDGSRFPRDLRGLDSETCTPTVLSKDAEAAQPCVPRAALSASDNTFADDKCSKPVFTGSINPRCGTPPDTGGHGLAYALVDGCQYPSGLYALGKRLTSFYSGPADTCSGPSDIPDNWLSFEGKTLLDFDGLPATRGGFIGSSRLQVEHVLTQAGEPIRTEPGFFDTTLDTRCHAQRFADGSTRCLPGNVVSASSRFADAECSVPAYVTFVGGCNPDADALRVRVAEELAPGACRGAVTKVFRLKRHSGAVYEEDGSNCTEANLDPSEVAFVDGKAIAPADLPEITLVEP